jgi:hypothetical protein
MNGIFHAAAELHEFFEARQWRYAIIGGLAVLRWGEPFATQDVDASLLCGFGNEHRYVDEILAVFSARIEDAAPFALANRVILIRATNGVAVDITLTGLEYEEEVIERSSPFVFAPNLVLQTCSAEDLVVLKAFADRPKDWAALRGVLLRQAGVLDWAYIEEKLAPLCEMKEEPELLERLMEMRTDLEG